MDKNSSCMRFIKEVSEVVQNFWNFFVVIKRHSVLAWVGILISIIATAIFLVLLLSLFLFQPPFPNDPYSRIAYYSSHAALVFIIALVNMGVIFFGMLLFKIGIDRPEPPISKKKSPVSLEGESTNSTQELSDIELDTGNLNDADDIFADLFSRGTSNFKEKTMRSLKEKNVHLPCPRCGTTKFDVLDGFSTTQFYWKPIGSVYSSSIPSVVIICKNCGYMSQHSLTILKIKIREENNDGS
jgi:predicted nucleic-acid-binding Zn-ribbon protein